MTQNFWLDGAVDNIFAPYDWSTGSPQAGDTLVVGAGMAFLGDSDIYGDTVVLSGQTAADQPTLIASGSATAAVLVAPQPNPAAPPGVGSSAFGIVEVIGAPHVALEVQGGRNVQSFGTVNIDGYSQMQGGFTGVSDNASVVINGGDTATFANSASSLTGNFDSAAVNANVVGDGTFDIGLFDSMAFTAGVSSGQTITDNGGSLTIGSTGNFHAAVDWTPTGTSDGSNQYIELSGLNADHYSYADGVLSLTSAGSDVFDLRLQTTPSSDVVAAQTSSGIDVYASAASASMANATVIAHA